MSPSKPTKHERLSGRRPKRWSELDLPTKEEMRRIGRWLSCKPDRTELPKTVNIDERKRKNRARAKAYARKLKWIRRHRREYNRKMRQVMRLRRQTLCLSVSAGDSVP